MKPVLRRIRAAGTALLLAGLLCTPAALTPGCASDSPTQVASSCTSCGSGNIYWDTSVDRCRDRTNGQFVKSCCCGR